EPREGRHLSRSARLALEQPCGDRRGVPSASLAGRRAAARVLRRERPRATCPIRRSGRYGRSERPFRVAVTLCGHVQVTVTVCVPAVAPPRRNQPALGRDQRAALGSARAVVPRVAGVVTEGWPLDEAACR